MFVVTLLEPPHNTLSIYLVKDSLKQDTVTILKALRMCRILNDWSFHVKFMKLAEAGLINFI